MIKMFKISKLKLFKNMLLNSKLFKFSKNITKFDPKLNDKIIEVAPQVDNCSITPTYERISFRQANKI